LNPLDIEYSSHNPASPAGQILEHHNGSRISRCPTGSKRILPGRSAVRSTFQASVAPGMGLARVRRVCCVLLLLSISFFASAESVVVPTTSDVEAAYLYNFEKFVSWPSDSSHDSAPFAICILGEDSFGESLNSLIADETHQGRKLVVRRLSSAAAGNDCQILFIGQSEESRLAKDLVALQKRPILTVSSLPGFLEHGGMIQFILQNRKVRFSVNMPAAGQAGLQLSSELLKVAVYVNTKPAQEATQ
jgi:hypothetical protein